MNAIILCGGLSTRLGELTKTIPKILLTIGDKTILDWQLEKLKTVGIKEVVLAAGHLANTLYGEVGEERLGIKLIYAIEDKKLGTGGAIKHAWNYLTKPNEPVIILNGDIMTNVDLPKMCESLKPESDGLLLAAYAPDVASYGTLEYNSMYHLKAFKEKEGIHRPGYQNGGYYIFNPSIKNYFPESQEFSVEYDVFPNVQNLYVYEFKDIWIDVGVPERLEWARTNWQNF